MEPLEKLVKTLWRGKLPLWVAFWVYGQGLAALLYGAYISMYVLTFQAMAGVKVKMEALDSWVVPVFKAMALVINVADAMGLALITVVWGVMVWRAAPNCSWVGWTWLARAFVAMCGVSVALGFYILWMVA